MRKRKILWFTPPFNKQVKTNIGNLFLKLVRRHFPPNHKLHRIFNRNTIKVGYSCTPNMDKIITNHNKKIISKSRNADDKQRGCDCRKSETCVVDNKCLTKCVIYRAQIYTRPDLKDSKYYVGLTKNSFKERLRGHRSSFNDIRKRNTTALSNHYWKLIQESKIPKIRWKILSKSNVCCGLYSNCNLCCDEKYEIIKFHEPDKLLNSRNDMISNCIHKKRLNLSHLD